MQGRESEYVPFFSFFPFPPGRSGVVEQRTLADPLAVRPEAGLSAVDGLDVFGVSRGNVDEPVLNRRKREKGGKTP